MAAQALNFRNPVGAAFVVHRLPGGGHGRVDAGRSRRCHQLCEGRAPAWKPHRELAHPGAGTGTALAP
jgi:hypothetical protein